MPEPDDQPKKNGFMPARPAAAERSFGEEAGYVPVVAIGASAGGLHAFISLLEAVPENAGMAFVLIQHLPPNHKSLMAELLGARTDMIVRQIEDGVQIEAGCVYVNPPGQEVTLAGNQLKLSDHPEGSAQRLPFDFFLSSLALQRGARAMCVVLSGTGHDGTRGLKSVKQVGGLVIAQEPEDADSEGMPRSAIQTGDVDAILTATQIPYALMNWNSLSSDARKLAAPSSDEAVPEWLGKVIQILFERTGTDFRLYKSGTLVRRITRRMGLAAAGPGDSADYVKLLASSPEECEALAADLLINVTRFFRDPQVFEFLATSVIPNLVRNHRLDMPLRVWVAGCSSGEEAWSLAMVLREAIDADGRGLRLQILASDVDPDAVATARAAIYPPAIAGDVSAERLEKFFVPDDRGYRIREDLRAQAVFTVQNLLSDPPFSRLDLISCRNVLIYLGPEAQTKIISLFHFGLVSNGVLLLGTSETAGDVGGRFEFVSKSSRIYRRVGRSNVADLDRVIDGLATDTNTPRFFLETDAAPERQFADACRRAVSRFYTPASVLVNRKGVCLHFLGPVDTYLDVPQGSASLEILPMVALSHRAALRDAIEAVGPERPLVQIAGVKSAKTGQSVAFNTEVRFIHDEGQDLILIAFQPSLERATSRAAAPKSATPKAAGDGLAVVELAGLSQELDHTTRLLERALETERKIRRESLRLNEEYQSTNEELVTSKEELQSLNEELSVLNSQLQEALERQRTTADDLKNVLYSTNVATVFLDRNLLIRFFTPATKSIFGVIATDIGRPLADLRSLAADSQLIGDAIEVLTTSEVIEREIATEDGVWFRRRILPYRAHSNTVEGVVITYVDVAEQHRATELLKAAIERAENTVISKTRFLASASHDLRQPLQTLTFIHGLLAREKTGPDTKLLIDRMEQAVGAMSGMMSTMLDINQIEAGVINYHLEDCPVSEILLNLHDEYLYHSESKSLKLKVVHSSAVIRTDRRLLEQMIRNLLSNAIRYTEKGCVLIGCRKRGKNLRIEIWDTGIGISDKDLPNVFGEYHKVARNSHEPSEGVGLGLSIVQRLADLLGHQIHVRSTPGRGSMFAVEIPLAEGTSFVPIQQRQPPAVAGQAFQTAHILVAEDDPDLRRLLEILLGLSGHKVTSAASLEAAIAEVVNADTVPDLLIADFNLPDGRNGLELARMLRQRTGAALPVIILTGDISVSTQTLIAKEGLIQLNKPVSPQDLEAEIQLALGKPRKPNDAVGLPARRIDQNTQVVIIDDDANFCSSLAGILKQEGLTSHSFPSGEAFLEQLAAISEAEPPVCVLIDAYLGGISGFDVLDAMQRAGSPARAIMITGNSDVSIAIKAMKAGAIDFIEKPVDVAGLRHAIDQALEAGRDASANIARRADAVSRIEKLTAREREVLDRILAGDPNKNIAADLGISQRTVESHRASVMVKTGCKTLPALVRLAVRATIAPPGV